MRARLLRGNCYHSNTILLGDFNIDFSRKSSADYGCRGLFEDFDDALSNFGLEQLMDFVTWSRLVNNVYKNSVLEHVYITEHCFTLLRLRS